MPEVVERHPIPSALVCRSQRVLIHIGRSEQLASGALEKSHRSDPGRRPRIDSQI